MNRNNIAIRTAFAILLPVLATSAAQAADRQPAAAEAARADIQKTLGFVPQFFLKFPPGLLPGAWEEMKTLQMNPSTALPPKVKELIGLAVAAQIPCRYCIFAHTEFAKLGGATEVEVGEAVAMAAITRHWSTFLNGIQTDETKFRGEVAKIVDNVKQAMASKSPSPSPVNVVDGQTALRDISQTLGYAPEFLKRFPDVARGGAWRQMRDVQLSPTTAIQAKNKELIGLAVASQVPCRFCIVAHTEFAKLAGATDAEITEAIAQAALTRDLSTVLNGMMVDEGQFHRDIDRLVKGARAAASKQSRATTTAQAR
ncbi:MAG TPA: carboxymuconolactone decarboxylase family protein [Polyangia bacterium]|jgi:AhpD family alkylhydroperoxidase|nr:carboxymuconolactone decarboxylase family protein [Polyangia bacterium]